MRLPTTGTGTLVLEDDRVVHGVGFTEQPSGDLWIGWTSPSDPASLDGTWVELQELSRLRRGLLTTIQWSGGHVSAAMTQVEEVEID